jgi:murein DD-endopeptidase MepM/ murein hydrolase activator NlpD
MPSPNDLNASASLKRAAAAGVSRAGDYLSKHPRSLTAAVAFALAGFGAAAFGIAPMVGPDVSLLPQQIVTESVVPEGMDQQLEALAEQELQLYRSDLTRSSDTADSLLRRLNVDDGEASAFLRADPVARKLLEGRAGKMVRVSTTAAGQLEELIARYAAVDSSLATTHFTRLRITRRDGGFDAAVETAALATQVRMGSGTIRSSLFAATDEARLPDVVASQLAEVFSTDINFLSELRKGDTFTVIYEALTADGEPITWSTTSGRVIAAEFVNDGRRHSALWFKDAQGRGGYFDLNGQSKRRSFLASPMEFSRVTSGFAMRMHPVLNAWKQHKGVDYAAPAGTPVRAVGDGLVEFAGWQNGYGNVGLEPGRTHLVEENERPDRRPFLVRQGAMDLEAAEIVRRRQQGLEKKVVGHVASSSG